MPEEKHLPPGATEAEAAAPAKVEEPKLDEPAKADEPEKKDDAAPADEKAPEAEKPQDEPEPPADPKLKKRTVYDDLKETRKEKKSEKERADAAEAKAAELQALLDAKDDAKTPEEKKEAADDIEAYAKENDLDPAGLKKFAQIILSKVPKPAEMPEGLNADEVKAWREDRAKAARNAEDAQILATAPAIQKQLSITEQSELDAVMAEVTRLAHTPEFHDKEVEYIVWKNQQALSKLVSPKKPSFESGGQRPDAEPEKPIDFSSGKVTPEQVASVATVPKQSYEVRSARQ